MVKIGLQISANLENIDELKTCHPSYSFFLKIKCSNCGEVSGFHDLSEEDTVDGDGRNTKGVNFLIKCKMCKRENSMDIIEGSNATYTAEDSGKFKTIVIFDCRGIEPEEFSPRDGWIAKSSENGPTFEDIDLSEDDWVEYDQKNQNSIGVYEFKSQFVKLKK